MSRHSRIQTVTRGSAEPGRSVKVGAIRGARHDGYFVPGPDSTCKTTYSYESLGQTIMIYGFVWTHYPFYNIYLISMFLVDERRSSARRPVQDARHQSAFTDVDGGVPSYPRCCGRVRYLAPKGEAPAR